MLHELCPIRFVCVPMLVLPGTLGLGAEDRFLLTLEVQVPNNHILAQNLYCNYYYPKPKSLIIGYLDPLGYRAQGLEIRAAGFWFRLSIAFKKPNNPTL